MKYTNQLAGCLWAFLFLLTTAATAQETWPVAAPSDQRDGRFAFTHANIWVDYRTQLKDATLLIADGVVVQAGTTVTIPTGTTVYDMTGKTIYPAFIDAYAADFGLPVPAAPTASGRRLSAPQAYSNKRGAYAWNEALRPEYAAADQFALDAKAADTYRKLGFGAVLTHRADGISRGTGALVCLSDLREHENILVSMASHHLSFRKGSSTQDYPSSLIGCVALVRQTYLDGQWYRTEGYKSEVNRSLDAWNAAQSLPQIFEASDKLDILRIHRIGQEFGVRYVVKSAGDEYQRLDEVKATGQALIVPLVFPEGYDVRDPYEAQNFSLAQLKHWELAPSNAARLAEAGIPFALTTAGLKDRSKFFEYLRRAIESGLTEETALRALTATPAELLGQSAHIGSLERGKVANFFVTDGPVFQPNTKIYQTWSKGRPFVFRDLREALATDAYGTYELRTGTEPARTLVLESGDDGPRAHIIRPDSTKIKVSWTLKAPTLTLTYQPEASAAARQPGVALSGIFQRNPTTSRYEASGRGTRPDGTWTDWSLTQVQPTPPADKAPKTITVSAPKGAVNYPFGAYGWAERPTAQTVLVKNATVWTGEQAGILPRTDVLIRKGKIAQIGQNLTAGSDAVVVDGTDMHLTAGIIDEHSHIAVARSINEGTQESSAEVRIGDALNSEDLDIYRQLAGGVTSSHLLHGSANPIGGQTQLIKMRWGYAPESLKFEGWPGQIKFALGENVKQSNWGDEFNTRYPQTRMGVEQVYMDYFTRAQEYLALKKSGKPYRRDLDLEALGEILEQKRFITCHSYVQSEIIMLMRVAERFGFRVNTFTHILEGYKVADLMAKHGAGGSTFADWWAYKMEVYDAIPYNAAMMHRQGVVVAINSDDEEMARRLNQEAAKAVEYGGVPEADAWNMVTLNPAKLLRVDDRVGSIKVGKDADLVLWNTHPLSVYARPMTTWVDGIAFYDRLEDERRRAAIATERARIIGLLMSSGRGGAGGEAPAAPKHHYHCDSDEDEGF
jgi:imidazolonepropionase-like amidohydrolase